ncbi:uncharacterized protein [Clytia hemisphaerica]|uniref:Uncharacterized protein n=1 Tax=Clytia hemisphaerica TaxID=252671 RepID=A0A7M5UFH6_9CNID
MSIGRGRGFLLSKISNTAPAPIGQNLMTPSQFVKADQTNITTEVQEPKKVEDVQMKKNNQQKENPKVDVSSQKLKDVQDKIKNMTMSQEDIDWQVYKFARKIKQTLKNVTEENLGDVYESIKTMINDRPLSSRFTGVSETKDILEVIIQNSIAEETFIQYSPCFVKMIHECSEVEFIKYFADIMHEKRKEVIRVVASPEILLSQSAKNFCTFLGKLFILPRQKSRKFFDTVREMVDGLIETWTLNDLVNGSSITGHVLAEKKVEAEAAHQLIKTISTGMLDCDYLLTEKMESFLWFIKESVLSDQIARELKELFLDAYIDIQCTINTQPPINEQRSDEESEVEIEEEILILDQEEENVKEVELNEEKEEPTERSDYRTIAYLLNIYDWNDLLQDFTDHNLTDSRIGELVEQKHLLSSLKEAGISTLLQRNIEKAIDKKGWSEWKKESLHPYELQSPTTPTGRPRSSVSNRMAMSFPKFGNSEEKKSEPSTPVSPRVYSTDQIDNNSLEIADPTSFDFTKFANNMTQSETIFSKSYETSYTNGVQEDDSSEETNSDVEIEIDDTSSQENLDTSSQDNENNLDAEIAGYTNTNAEQTQPEGSQVPLIDHELPKISVGRGRGMVKFLASKPRVGGANYNYAKNDKPVAKVHPSGRDVQQNGRHGNSPPSWRNNQQENNLSRNSPQTWRNNNQQRNGRESDNTQNRVHRQKNGSPYQKKEKTKAFNNKNSKKMNFQSNSNSNQGQSSGRFQTVYRPKDSQQKQVAQKPVAEFGSRPPNMCFKCSSLDHMTEECSVNNFFF